MILSRRWRMAVAGGGIWLWLAAVLVALATPVGAVAPPPAHMTIDAPAADIGAAVPASAAGLRLHMAEPVWPKGLAFDAPNFAAPAPVLAKPQTAPDLHARTVTRPAQRNLRAYRSHAPPPTPR